jgi:hypothetical protein
VPTLFRSLLVPLLLLASVAHATVFAPVDDATMVRASDLVVVGNVTAVDAVEEPDGRIVTRTTLAVDRVLKGRARRASLVVTTPGGRVGDRTVVVYGSPSFHPGEAVLVYLQRTVQGELRPRALAMSVYWLSTAADGTPQAERLAPFHEVRPLAELTATIAALSPDTTADGGSVTVPAPTPVVEHFTFLGPPFSRWFEPDSGQPVRYRMANADDTLGQAGSDVVVDAAFAAWTNVPTATIVLERGSMTPTAPSVAGGHCDGNSVVQFNDPFNEIPALMGCGGVLAVGGFCNDASQSKVVNGTTFERISEGDLTVNNGLGSCLMQSGYEEIVTHEVGHTIGLGHSSDNPNEPNPTLRDATMYFLAHLDGRGATLMSDDIAGVSAIYPSMTDPNDLDGDGVPNARDACPSTPAGTPVDSTGCGCGEAGHVACDDQLSCTIDFCDAASGRCAVTNVDCTGGDTCLVGTCDETTGCHTEPVTGDAAATCIFDRAFPPGSCLPEPYPAKAGRLYTRAAHAADRAVKRGRPGLAQRALRELDRVLAMTTKAAARRRHPIDGACVAAVGIHLGDAHDRLTTWLATQQ